MTLITISPRLPSPSSTFNHEASSHHKMPPNETIVVIGYVFLPTMPLISTNHSQRRRPRPNNSSHPPKPPPTKTIHPANRQGLSLNNLPKLHLPLGRCALPPDPGNIASSPARKQPSAAHLRSVQETSCARTSRGD